MNCTTSTIFIFLLALLLGGSVSLFLQKKGFFVLSSQGISQKCSLQNDMRRLWADHVIWTRQYIVSALAHLDDTQFALDRLLKNQQDLGHAIVRFHNEEAGKKLADLLTEHIVAAGAVVAAAQKGEGVTLKEANAKLHKNAQDIAKFLSEANKYWPYQTTLDMLNMHLELLTREIDLRLKKDWDADVTNVDAICDQAREMADTFTQGLVKQFPDKF